MIFVFFKKALTFPFSQQEDSDRVSKNWKIQERLFMVFPDGFSVIRTEGEEKE